MNLDKRLLGLTISSRSALIMTITLGFFGGVLIVVKARLLSQVISRVFLDGQLMRDVAVLLGMILGVFLLLAMISWGVEVAANAVAGRVKTDLRLDLFNHILAMGPADVSGERTGELVNVATEGIEALDAYYRQYLPQLVLAVLVPLTFLAFIFPLDTLSAVVLLLTAPLIPLFMILIGHMAEAVTKKQWETLSRLSAYYLDVLLGLTTLKILGRSRAQIAVIAKISEQYRQRTMGVLRVTFLSALVLEMVATLSIAVVAVEIGLRLLYGRLDFDQALFVLLLAPEFYLPLRMLGTRFHAGMTGVVAADRIFEILDQPVEDREKQVEANIQDEIKSSQFKLQFRDVHHAYEDSRHTLKGVSFSIAPGQMVALVGPSGAGKSTVANLLLRFIEPTQGQITVGKRSLADFSPDSCRAQFAWVPQKPYLFNDTVLANILMARPESSFEEVVGSARRAHAHEFIERLPQGYDTVIGEGGSRLSAGEAQRIAIARAFLKDAPFLILDEMTSNLDPENEALIRETMESLVIGRSALVIAHRLSTVFKADKIVLLNKGRIAAVGSHSRLLQVSGLYRYMVEAYTDSQKLDEAKDYLHSIPATGYHRLTLSKDGYTHITDLSDTPQTAHLGTLWRLLDFVKPYSKLVALSVVLGFATVGSGIGLMTSSAYLISEAALQPSIADLQVVIVAVRFFGIARGLFRYLERLVSHQVTFRLLARLRVWFYQALEPLAPARVMYYKSGDLINRAMGDINTLENFYVRSIAPPLVALLVAVTIGVYLWFFSPVLAINLILFLLAAGLLVPIWTRWLSRGVGRRYIHARAALSVTLVDGIQGLADLLAFGQEGRQSELLKTQDRQLASTQKQMAHIGGMQSAMETLLANMGMWTTLTIGIILVGRSQIDGMFLASLALAAITSFEAVLPLPLAAQYLERNLVAAQRLFEIVDAEPEVKDPPKCKLPPREFNIDIHSLCFRYPPELLSNPSSREESSSLKLNSYILENLSFTLSQGKRVAVVGPSGSGKSTIISLLLRFWEYNQGEILINGENIRSFSQEALRKNIGVVSQRTYLFNATVLDNLRIARPQATESEIVTAAKNAQIHDFIYSLPQGYDTWVGDRGMRLSGGERQRVAIARALLKDAPLLILDEATAHLDALSERHILGSIFSLMEDRTILMITHRLVGLDTMDEILVLRGGRIVERGCHTDLLQSGGLYRRMWDFQNQMLLEK